ncbi:MULTISPECIES: hypothetical protein, partial [Blautia]|uniref:hypothetical protein n=1 Tax=Blautia TaxID=572511 RepID=UPI001A9B8B18
MEEKKKINQVRFEELRSKGFPKGCLDHCYLDGIIIESKRLNFRYDRKNPRLLSSSRSTLTIH